LSKFTQLLLRWPNAVTAQANDGSMIKSELKISFRDNGKDTCLEVATPKTPEFVAALTESLRATNIRAKLQFTVRKPELWVAQLRLMEADGAPLSLMRASELLRAFESQSIVKVCSELERDRAA
jgi:hypothetical protein